MQNMFVLFSIQIKSIFQHYSRVLVVYTAHFAIVVDALEYQSEHCRFEPSPEFFKYIRDNKIGHVMCTWLYKIRLEYYTHATVSLCNNNSVQGLHNKSG